MCGTAAATVAASNMPFIHPCALGVPIDEPSPPEMVQRINKVRRGGEVGGWLAGEGRRGGRRRGGWLVAGCLMADGRLLPAAAAACWLPGCCCYWP
jgi:hypothetical protein